MLRTRVMPCLLLRNGGLVKTIKFKSPSYIGDPINAIKIYNEKEVDELVFLDITATVEHRRPPFDLIADIAAECFMPFAYGGGIRDLDDAKELFRLGVEKIVMNTFAVEQPSFVTKAAESFGSQSVVGCIDAKRTLLGKYEVYTHGGRKGTGLEAAAHARNLQELGIGEVFVNSIDRDGTMDGFDVDLIRRITEAVTIPVIACGGAGSVADLVSAVKDGGASAVAVGSMVVYQGRNRAVLINFPTHEELERALN